MRGTQPNLIDRQGLMEGPLKELDLIRIVVADSEVAGLAALVQLIECSCHLVRLDHVVRRV